MIQKQNNFSRSLANDKKMGAYYTDLFMCKRISYLFDFPEDEVSVLEPSIGDASALQAVVGKQDNVKVFGVELNTLTYEEQLKDNPFVDYCLNTDFLYGVKISHTSFGFCFANPPYGTNERGERLEQKFLEKLHPYMKSNAPIAYVIPYYVALDEKFLKCFMSRFQPWGIFRFDDAVYSQFKQVVLVGTKKNSIGVLRKNWQDFYEQYKEIENLPYLPNCAEEVERKLFAVPSEAEKIEYFTTLEFHRDEAAKYLNKSSLADRMKRYFVPAYHSGAIGQPPIPLKKDLLYMLAVSGGGQGMVGSEEKQDVHLQRGCAKVVTRSEIRGQKEENAASSSMAVEIETSCTEITLNIIQNDGTITLLK